MTRFVKIDSFDTAGFLSVNIAHIITIEPVEVDLEGKRKPNSKLVMSNGMILECFDDTQSLIDEINKLEEGI